MYLLQPTFSVALGRQIGKMTIRNPVRSVRHDIASGWILGHHLVFSEDFNVIEPCKKPH
jgi:hypothetical protein